ncbi:MAG: hypothetical protein C4522_20615 [Desulfobacteraceae bacterium]|nr:MAG: hypothetical protein C4522_20615 [Desulfobacteraceae bacterium]
MNIAEFIIDQAFRMTKNSNAKIISGHNGPYFDPGTLVRNYSHWLITYANCYKWTNDRHFLTNALHLADYLSSSESRPYNFSFHHRNKQGKDQCNGLIGQAWTFEALKEASTILEDDKYLQIAEDVFFLHRFDEKQGLWHCLEIDGRILPIDTAFNHQLWFAACSSLITSAQNTAIMNRISRFLDCLDHNVTILPDGLIFHPIEHLWEKYFCRQFTPMKRLIKTTGYWLKAVKKMKLPEEQPGKDQIWQAAHETLVYKSIGYHAFNMYAFAILKLQIPDHPFWETAAFQKSIDYMLSEDYKNKLNDNIYGYPYNPPGFELPFSLYVLKNISMAEIIDTAQFWIQEQLQRSYNHKTAKLDKSTEDPETLTARLYETTRLPKEILEQVEVNCSVPVTS